MSKLALLFLTIVFILCFPLVIFRYLWAIVTNPTRALEIAIVLDRLGNTAANGADSETISSRAGRGQIEGQKWACILCKVLDRIQKNHCKDSIGT